MCFRRSSSKLGSVLHLSALALLIALAVAVAGCSHERTDASRLAALLKVGPGMVVADVGAGRGATAVVMAHLVGPKGHVYAADINPRTVPRVRGAVRAAHLDNVSVIAAGPSKLGLPAGCCQAIFLRRVYHKLAEPVAYDATLMRALRPGGDLAILDFRPTLPWPLRSKGTSVNARRDGVDPMIIIHEVTDAGFEYTRMIDPWPGSWFVSSYCLLFKKPPQGPATARSASAPSSPSSTRSPTP